MGFANTSNVWKSGCNLNKIKHASTRVKEHESSDVHVLAAESYIRFDQTKRIEDLMNREQAELRSKNIKNNQDIVKRIVNWILCIGRQGIAYRGSLESTKYFSDKSVNHGNLLEVMRTASQYDEKLRFHLEKCESLGEKDINNDTKGPKGRGSKLTFLSKTTFNKIIFEIGDAMKKIIVKKIKESGFYSLMVDSTQDISGHEQCAIVIRFVNATTFEIEEKLVGILLLTDTTGEGYFNAIFPYLEKLGLPVSMMVACSFDGASNMRSDEVGLQRRLKAVNDIIVYIWCFAHNLNLCVCESVSSTTSARNLFGLLQTPHNFCSASYKRIAEWEKLSDTLKGRKKLIRFENFGKTRWYSDERSLTKIFGSYKEPSTEIFLALLQFLHNIKTSKSYEPQVSFEASALLDNWTKLETIVTAFTFLKVFEVLGPVSRYFQTKGADLMAALNMSKTATEDIRDYRDSFDELKEKAISFAKIINDKIPPEMNAVNEELLTKRVRMVKRLPGEKAIHEPIIDAWQNLRINDFFVVIDTTTQTLCNRFNSVENEEVVKEMSFFLPTKFEGLSKQKILELPFLSRVLKVDSKVLVSELNHFAKHFSNLLKVESVYDSIEDLVLSDVDEEEGHDDDDERVPKCSIKKKPCNKCLKCCFLLLSKLNLHVSTYSNLHRAYEYFMTLPCTQVECERTFSKLRIVKSRLRSALKQKLLEPLLFMFVERELTFDLNVDEIVLSFGRSTAELRRHLIE